MHEGGWKKQKKKLAYVHLLERLQLLIVEEV